MGGIQYKVGRWAGKESTRTGSVLEPQCLQNAGGLNRQEVP